MPSGKKWFTKTKKAVLNSLKSSKEGLSQAQATKRLEKYGPNKLEEPPKPSALARFIGQFSSAPILMLIGAIIILIFLSIFGEEKHWTDAMVIFIVIFINAIMGYIQEANAEKALEALKKLTSQKVKVIRDGELKVIDVQDVVPGEILSLEEGDKVPSDGRIIEDIALEVDESSLTGESVPVLKQLKVIDDPKTPLADQVNMVFMGTIVTRGKGLAVVTSTGMDTEMGKIAGEITEEEPTPLQKKLDKLGKQISMMAILAVVVLIIIDQLVMPGELFQSFLLAVSLAVAIIPEGLPIVMLVTLAIGMQIMAKKNAIIRKLPAIEALGSTTVICTDKTGTLTRNEMTVKEMWIGGRYLKVTGDGYRPTGNITRNGKVIAPTAPAMDQALRTMVLCNNSNLMSKDGQWSVVGDPTEGALLVVAGKVGVSPQAMFQKMPRSGEKVFDPRRKMMTTIHAVSGKLMAFIKGAPEVLLDLATSTYDGNEVVKLTHEMRQRISDTNKAFAKKTYRVLALGFKPLEGNEDMGSHDFERGLTFIGMVGIIDPVREDARTAIADAQKAGIKLVMITGDQRETAEAVAKALDLSDKGRVMTGVELESISDKRLKKVVKDISVFARVSPEHKTRIVVALKSMGEIVAMTGDGVNDAPALNKADIGISMGMTGTDVAREASDMVLTDDNFKSIVSAVEEGRRTFDNIRKFIRYQLSTNVGALLLLYIATMGIPEVIAMYPVQLLWVNIMMDGPPAVALGLEPMNPNLMKRPPRPPKESVLSRRIMNGLIFNGIVMGIAAVILFYWALNIYDGPDKVAHAQTLTFTAFVLFQMFNVFNCRSLHRSAFSIPLHKNRFLAMAVGASVLLQLAVVYAPPFQFLFKTVPLGWMDWVLIGIMGLVVLFSEEIKKAYLRKIDNE